MQQKKQKKKRAKSIRALSLVTPIQVQMKRKLIKNRRKRKKERKKAMCPAVNLLGKNSGFKIVVFYI